LNFKGGYKISLQGWPDCVVQTLPWPETLYLLLYSRRFFFSDIYVKEGQHLEDGDVLAKNSDN
jgi:hypothetical protein